MERPIIFYDGNCGLCHSLVKFVLKQDKGGIFNFSPQQGQALKVKLDERAAALLPDSVYLMDKDGKIYLKAFALSFILKKLGGIWGILGFLYTLLPWKINNFLYDCMAKSRYAFFSRKENVCPVVPEVYRSRFLA